MAKERLPMHRVREVLRLKYVCCLSNRKIARACGVDRDTVGMYLKRAKTAGIGWPLPEGLADSELEAQLFPRLVQKPPGTQRSLPDCQYIYEELRSYKKKVSLTLMQLWFEYKEQHPEGYQCVLPASGRISEEAGVFDVGVTARRARGPWLSAAARGRWLGGNSRASTAAASAGPL